VDKPPEYDQVIEVIKQIYADKSNSEPWVGLIYNISVKTGFTRKQICQVFKWIRINKPDINITRL